jgi:hypothetical protein
MAQRAETDFQARLRPPQLSLPAAEEDQVDLVALPISEMVGRAGHPQFLAPLKGLEQAGLEGIAADTALTTAI